MTNYPRKRNLRDGGFLTVGKHGEERSPKVLLIALGTGKQR